MTFIDTIILGIIEGLTEFLPISSTAHLIIAGDILRIPKSEFLKTFDIFIQLGAMSAVIVLYFKSFLNIEILKKIMTAFLPTAVIGFLLYKFIKSFLFENNIIIALALIIGGVILIFFELRNKEETKDERDIKDITYKQSFLIGLMQSLAVIPGVSRSAATIIGGLIQGISRKTIVEFSFLVAVPTIGAATFYDLLKSGGSFASADLSILSLGFIVSFFIALISIKFLLKCLSKKSFIFFGVYRIIVGLVILFFN